MNASGAVFRELIGLFVDDRGLALGILAVVALAGAVRALMPEATPEAGAVLLFGCLGLLIVNATRAAQR